MTDRTHPDSGRIITSGDVIAELHDRIAELEAQLEAVGAGGVQALAANAPATKPAATVYMMEALVPGGLMKHHVQLLRPLPAGTLLYTAPPAPTEQWVSVEERLPEPGKAVLLDIGKKTPIRAMWAAKHTVEVAADDESDFGEYDEERDVYYCPEGWYEWNEHEETHWAVTETALHWQPMPAPPQGAAK